MTVSRELIAQKMGKPVRVKYARTAKRGRAPIESESALYFGCGCWFEISFGGGWMWRRGCAVDHFA